MQDSVLMMSTLHKLFKHQQDIMDKKLLTSFLDEVNRSFGTGTKIVVEGLDGRIESLHKLVERTEQGWVSFAFPHEFDNRDHTKEV